MNGQHMDGRTRLLVVGGAAALLAYLWWPSIRGEMGEVLRQVPHTHVGFPPTWGMHLDETLSDPIEDRRGERRGRGGDLESQLGPRWPRSGEARADEGRHYRRWRDCPVSRNGRLDCGPWHTGPAPEEE